MPPAKIAYVMDRALWADTNARERNFWFAYVEEMLDQMGATSHELPPDALGSPDALAGCSSLIVGPVRDAQALADHADALAAWVQAGGVLIGLGCEGLDELFGIKASTAIRQPIDDFTPNGSFELLHLPVAAQVHSYLHPAQRLLVLSDVRSATPTQATAVAPYFYANGRRSPFSAITQRQLGRGWAFCFAFDVAKTLWVLHHGRPVDRDYDGDGYRRTGDARVIGANEEEVLYADEILLLVQNMIGRRPHGFVCPSPPVDGQVPDALLYWGGDDEGATDVQLPASEFMASRGLPYHINVMPHGGRIHLSRETAEKVWANGHELAVHYNHTERNPDWSFNQADVEQQAQLFHQAFGRRSECSVNHCCTWVGWAEPAKWMAACGATGDNSRIHSATPPMNPVNQVGFSFGTSLPYHFYDDWRAGNARIDLVEEPITGYELGHPGDRFDPDVVHKAIDLAVHYRLALDMFYHPIYIAQHANCRAAIDEALAYIKRRGLRIKHMGNDALARWWRERSASSVDDFASDDGQLAFTARTDYADGMVVKVPVQNATAAQCTAAGRALASDNSFEFGQNWIYVVVPKGETRVQIQLA